MPLPFFKKNAPTRPQREYFFALEISHSQLRSAIWSVVNDKTQVLSVGSTASWDGISDESLISGTDKTLSESTTKLDGGGQIQPEKIILGLPPDWMSDDKIDPVRLRTLKRLAQKLSLVPVGFVITPEAAVRYLQHSEGVPPTAILLGVDGDRLETIVVKLGKIEGVQVVQRSSHITADVVEGLSRFSHLDMLPSRILIFGYTPLAVTEPELEEARQMLLAHPWQAPQTRLPFLHFPKVELLPLDFGIRAVTLAGGTEVARAIGLIGSEKNEVEPTTTNSDREDIENIETTTYSAADLGFISGDGDIEEALVIEEGEETIEPRAAAPVATPPHPLPRKKTPLRLPRFGFPVIGFSSKPALFIAGLVVLGISLFAAYWNLPRAVITLTVNPKPLQHQFEIIANTKSQSPDLESKSLPAQYVETTVNDEKTNPTTGSQLVGDKATGTVTLINGTSVPRSFAAGTVITSPSGLKFTLDAEVQVASASGTADPNSYQPGKGQGKVTASQIGSDSNLSAGTQFKVGSFSSLDYVARNEEALVGGSSRQAQAVAKEDLAKLRSELTQGLKDQARQQLLGEASSDRNVIQESVQVEVASEEFNHKVGEEAGELTLRLTVKAKALSVAKSDLDQLVDKEIEGRIPQGYSPAGEPNYQFSVKKVDSDNVTLSAQISASLMPQYDTSAITRDITGKKPTAARDYLGSLPGAAYIDFAFTPRLPGPLLTLPHVTKNIYLEVKPAQ